MSGATILKITVRSTLRLGLVCSALASVPLATPAATAPGTSTAYFVNVAGSTVPLPIAAFSSDARADVGSFSYGTNNDQRPAHGKFSIRTAGSPFAAGKTFGTMVVLAQTPAKLVTFTFTNVTIDADDATSSTRERVTFEAANYDVKFTSGKDSGGQTTP